MVKINKIMTVFMLIAVVFAFAAPVFGVSWNEKTFEEATTGGSADSNVKGITARVWNTVISVVQVLAVGAVVFAGLRYMFASADAKADIKKQTVILVVGAILVFGATYIVQLISNIAEETIGG